jgi:hypothetical protein
MKFLKWLGVGLGGLVLLLLVLPLFLRDEYYVLREIVVDKPRHIVYDYIVLLKNRENFVPAGREGTNITRSYNGTDGKVGFIYSWNSSDPLVGQGELEIKKIIPLQRIDYSGRLVSPIKGTSESFLKLEDFTQLGENAAAKPGDKPAVPQHTKIIWGMQGRAPYPFHTLILFMNPEKFIGEGLETSLRKLKEILEKSPKDAKRG